MQGLPRRRLARSPAQATYTPAYRLRLHKNCPPVLARRGVHEHDCQPADVVSQKHEAPEVVARDYVSFTTDVTAKTPDVVYLVYVDKDGKRFEGSTADAGAASSRNALSVTLTCRGLADVEGDNTITLLVPLATTVGDLKDCLEQLLAIPMLCQRIVVGKTGPFQVEPKNFAGINVYSNSAGQVSFTLIVSLDRVLLDLSEPGTGPRRKRAFAALIDLGTRGGDEAVKALLAMSKDETPLMRQATALALKRLLPPGHFGAIKAARRLTGDTHTAVRRAAWVALEYLAEVPGCLTTIQERLASSCAGVRTNAIEMLCQMANDGESLAVSGMAVCIEYHHFGDVKRIATEVMPTLIDEKNIKDVVAELCLRLKHREESVRILAGELLAKIAAEGDECAVVGICQHLENMDDEIRFTAAQALMKVATEGDPCAIVEVCRRLDHEQPRVRELAMDLMGRLVSRGDSTPSRTASPPLSARSAESDAGLRKSVIAVIAAKAREEDENAIQAISDGLHHTDTLVRRSAAKTLRRLAGVGNKSAIRAVARCMESRIADVRQTGVETISEIAGRGNKFAMDIVAALASSSDPETRCTALKALARVARVGNPEAIEVVLRRLEDRDPGVRRAAVGAVDALIPKGDPSAVAAIVDKLTNWDPDLRCTAAQALAAAAEPRDGAAVEALLRGTRDVDSDVQRACSDAVSRLFGSRS